MSSLSSPAFRTRSKDSQGKGLVKPKRKIVMKKSEGNGSGKPKRRIVIRHPKQKDTHKTSGGAHSLPIHKSFDEDSQDKTHGEPNDQDEKNPEDIEMEELHNSSGSENSTPQVSPREDKHPPRREMKILAFDAEAIKAKLVKKDPKLSKVFAKVKLDFKEIVRPPYVALIGAVIGQKIKYPLAKKIREALFTSLGTNFTLGDVGALPDSQLIKFGISRAKVQIIRDASTFIEENRLTLSSEEEIRSLTKVRGIGEWTVTNILLVTMANLNLFPPSDVWMERKIRGIYGKVDTATLLKKWSPYATIVAWHLWRLPDEEE